MLIRKANYYASRIIYLNWPVYSFIVYSRTASLRRNYLLKQSINRIKN